MRRNADPSDKDVAPYHLTARMQSHTEWIRRIHCTMPRYDGSATQRHTIWTVHGEKCYQCGQPVDLQSMQVDHVVPQSLKRDSAALAKVLQELGRPKGFKLHGFENLLPCCAPCNRRKSNTLWQPSLAIQRELQNAQTKADRVERLIEETKNKKGTQLIVLVW